ncbi:hypothetical protein AU106_gp236 [Sinorhizobium phage phiM9]|uniref:Uncharacterized protein n=1 Tax=Sinorhizobium phage phiM9 TaxID=1636182 RepID=A0A0F6R555_9CAUD|nr:hypothetical protein AU106_gp236 [Sinorhizobium phage phiM9]AKE44867.1 hypothetical protein Sm_phiM9_240 [Sinorhizobium phage phiM9]
MTKVKVLFLGSNDEQIATITVDYDIVDGIDVIIFRGETYKYRRVADRGLTYIYQLANILEIKE